MPATLSIKIEKLLVNNQFGDSGGNWQYVGAEAVEQSSNEAVKLIAMKRDNSTCGVGFPASMLTATVIFSTKDKDTDVSDNLTIQGLHDLTSNNETGSVSSASSRFAEYIGGTFSFKAGLLTINGRGW